MDGTTRAVAWVKEDRFGVEFAEIVLARDHLLATGVAIGTAPLPYRLDYTLDTTARFVTTRLRVKTRGQGWSRELDLRRHGHAWDISASGEGAPELGRPGGEPSVLAGALDCDLELSPVTNLMPVLRHGVLAGGGPVELIAAWVSVPDLRVQADGQRYTFLRAGRDHRVIRYEATDGTFAADFTVDLHGLAIDYPGIARRL